MRRAGFAQADCQVARSVAGVGDGWSLLIIRDAPAGERWFREFQASLGVTGNILTARLMGLVAVGVPELVPTAAGGRRTSTR